MHALIAGQRDPTVLAAMARGRLRAKTTALQEALTGFFTDHHAAIPQRLSILGPPKANVRSPAAIRAHADELR